MYGNHNNGYAVAAFSELYGEFRLFNETMDQTIKFSIPSGKSSVSFLVDGDICYCRGKQVVFTRDMETDGSNKYYMLDLTNFDDTIQSSQQWGSNSAEDYVAAEYDIICLSDSGVYYAEEGDDNFYIDEHGNTIEDSYADHSPFIGSYSLVMDENGLVYLIDADFNVLSEGFEADSMEKSWVRLGYVKDNVQTIIVMEE